MPPRHDPGVEVDVFERLPTPFGLIRAHVAPDHQHTK
jgi:ferredoxin--NADP+ reductase